jgi:hypothetical protein
LIISLNLIPLHILITSLILIISLTVVYIFHLACCLGKCHKSRSLPMLTSFNSQDIHANC